MSIYTTYLPTDKHYQYSNWIPKCLKFFADLNYNIITINTRAHIPIFIHTGIYIKKKLQSVENPTSCTIMLKSFL